MFPTARVMFAATSSVLALAASAAETRPNPQLPSGDALESLNEFSRQTGLQILFALSLVQGKKTQALDGSLPPVPALAQLLKGTSLEYTFVDERTVALVAAPPPRTPRRRNALNIERIVVVKADQQAGIEPAHYGPQLRRPDIDLSGESTVPEFLRNLPQFAGNLCDDGLGDSSRASHTNSSRGCALDARGLGANATLVLFDSQRIAPGGDRGAFVDISSIPLTAIDHIDTAPDGSSVVLGTDTMGGWVNFVPRKNVEGSDTQVRVTPAVGDAVGERLLSQTSGAHWNGGNLTFSFEYYARDHLPTAARAQATSDLRSFGGPNFGSLFAGNLLIGSETWAIQPPASPAAATPTLVRGTTNTYDTRRKTDILPAQERESGYLNSQIDLQSQCTLELEGLASRRHVTAYSAPVGSPISVPFTNAYYFNPTGGSQPLNIEVGFQNLLGAARLEGRVWDGDLITTAHCPLAGAWSLETSLGYTLEHQADTIGNLVNNTALQTALADDNPATAFDPFEDRTSPSTIENVRSSSRFVADSQMALAHVIAQRTAKGLHGADITVLAGADVRTESLSTKASQRGDASADARLRAHRNVASLFSEVCVPLLGREQDQCAKEGAGEPGQLHARIAGRYEHYSDFRSGGVPVLRLFWLPSRSFWLRQEWSKSYRVPDLADLSETSDLSLLSLVPSPYAPSRGSPVLFWSGNNADLRRETAETWSLTANYHPESIEGLAIEAHYFDTDFRDRIDQPAFTADILTNPALRPFVTLNPSAELQQTVCSRSTFLSLPTQCLSTPVDAVVDIRLRNISGLRTRGVDLNATQAFPDPHSEDTSWLFNFNGSYVLRYVLSDPSGSSDLTNTVGNPLRVRFTALLSRTQPGWRATASVRYASAYHDLNSVPARSVSSWTVTNLQLAWKPPLQWAGANALVTVDVQNIFDVRPPIVFNPIGLAWDPTNASALGRTFKVTVSKHW
jgi:iron complex outermembrane recepter protein